LSEAAVVEAVVVALARLSFAFLVFLLLQITEVPRYVQLEASAAAPVLLVSVEGWSAGIGLPFAAGEDVADEAEEAAAPALEAADRAEDAKADTAE
jgi:hypothetical protein